MDRRRTRVRGKVETAPQPPVVTGKRTTATTNVTTTTRSSPGRTTRSPGRRASPVRTRHSPVRRSSRPRSNLGATISATTVIVTPSPIKEAAKEISPKSKQTTKTKTTPPAASVGTTRISSITSRLPLANKSPKTATTTTTSSIISSYSSTTEKTVEIRGGGSTIDKDIAKLGEFLRRSVSKSIVDAVNRVREGSQTPTTNTEPESRYSRSVSRSVYGDDNYSKAEFSDNENEKDDAEEEEEEHYKSFDATTIQPQQSSEQLLCRKLQAPREFGGWFGAAIIMLLAPCIVYYLQWSCTRTNCSWKPLNLTALYDGDSIIRRVFKGDAVGAYLAFSFGAFVLSALLPGRHVRLPTEPRSSVEYKFNVLSISLVLSIALGIAEYLKYPVADFVLRNYLRFCIYGFINAYILAQWAYLRTDMLHKKTFAQTQPNIYGKTGNFIIDFAQGRQLNPKWLGFVEFKQVFYRIALLTTLLFAQCFLYKNIQLPKLEQTGAALPEGIVNVTLFYAKNSKYDLAALVAATMLLIYILDAIIFEHHLASSFELQGEGFGCLLLLRYAATPYLLSSVAKYFLDRRIAITCKYAVYAAFILLLAGLVLKRFSSAIKYKYRVNPASPIFYGIDTIHTFQGRRLLLGGLWGRLRQPNYAGDILALLALAVPLYWRFAWPPAIGLLLCIVLLLHRSVRVNTRNYARYHSSWVRYCSMVHNYVVPKIF